MKWFSARQGLLLAALLGGLAALEGASSWSPARAADEPAPLAPAEARKKVGERITVQFEVKAAKDRLEKRGEIFLDADADFRSEANFAVVVTRNGAASFQAKGISDVAEHFRDRVIRATGTVKVVDDVPRIEIDDADELQRVEKP